MAWGDRASARFSVDLVGGESIGRVVWGAVQAMLGTTPDMAPRYELQVKDVTTGEIVARTKYEGGVAGDQALADAKNDLEDLSVAAFCEKYGFEEPA